MRVRAIETGYDNVAIRQPGEEFDMPDGASAPWFEPVEPPKVEVKSKKAGKADDLT